MCSALRWLQHVRRLRIHGAELRWPLHGQRLLWPDDGLRLWRLRRLWGLRIVRRMQHVQQRLQQLRRRCTGCHTREVRRPDTCRGVIERNGGM